MKNFLSKFKWFIAGGFIFLLAFWAFITYAVNVTIPQATNLGDLPTGKTSGNYQLLHPGSDGLVLTSSSTSPNGLAWQTASSTGGSGITSLNGLVGSTQLFATNTTATGLNFNITSTGSTHTFAASLQGGYIIPLSASTTNWNNFFNTPSTQITAGTNLSWTGNTLNGTMASSTLTAGGIATFSPNITLATTTDTNLLLSIVCGTATCTYNPAWTGTLAAARLNANVVQGFTNDTNVTATISAQNATLGWQGVLAVARGGIGTTTLGSLTVGSNLSIAGGQNVLIGTSTQISLGANVVTTLATGTAGNIFNGSIGSNTLTLNLPFASASNTGQLQSGDWTTFNNKLGSYNVVSANNLLSVSTTTNLATLTVNESPSFTGTLNVNGTSTLATTTISQLSLGNGLTNSILAVDGSGKVIATTTSAGGVTAVNGSGSILSSGGTTPVIQLQNLTNTDILFGQGTNIIGTSSNLTFANNTLTVTNASTTNLTVATNSYLGTVQSGILTGATGLPLTTGVTGVLPIGNGGVPVNGAVNQILGNSALNTPAWVNASSTSVLYIDTNGTNTIQNGSTVYPFHTLSAAIASSTGYSAYAYFMAPGTYVDGAPDTFPNAPTFLDCHGATLVNGSNNFTFQNSFDAYDCTVASAVFETDTSLSHQHQFNNSVLTSNFTGSGNVIMSNDVMTGTTSTFTILPGALANVVGSLIYNTIKDWGVLNLNDVEQIASTTTYAIQATTTGSQVNINGMTMIQNGNGGAINIQNGATSSPNNVIALSILSNSTTPGSTLNFGTANTSIADYNDTNFIGQTIYANGSAYVPLINGSLVVQSTSTLQGNLVLSNLTGTQCLQEIAGVVSGTGSGCGSGGGSISTSTNAIIGHEANWTGLATLGNGAWLDNGTVVGFGATSTTIGFNIQGTAGTNDIFDIASSTAKNIIKIPFQQNVWLPMDASSTISSTSVGSATSTLLLGSLSLSSPSANGTYLGINSPTSFTGNFENYQNNGTNEFKITSSGVGFFNGGLGVGTTTTAALVTLQGSSGSTADLLDIASSTGANIFQVLNSTQSVLSVGTTSTASNLIVQGNSSFPTQPLFILSSSTGATLFEIDANGHRITGGTTPTCDKGCTATDIWGDDSNIRVIDSSTAVSTLTITFAVPYAHSPDCFSNEASGGTVSVYASSTPTNVVLTFASSLTSKVIDTHCEISNNFIQ